MIISYLQFLFSFGQKIISVVISEFG